MTTIKIEHCRAVFTSTGKGYCTKGLRLFAQKHNLDWSDFIKNGIDSSKIAELDDALAQAVIAEAEKDGR